MLFENKHNVSVRTTYTATKAQKKANKQTTPRHTPTPPDTPLTPTSSQKPFTHTRRAKRITFCKCYAKNFHLRYYVNLAFKASQLHAFSA